MPVNQMSCLKKKQWFFKVWFMLYLFGIKLLFCGDENDKNNLELLSTSYYL